MRVAVTRLVRVCLWLLLVVYPIWYCLLVIGSDILFVAFTAPLSDIYIAGQALSEPIETPPPAVLWLQEFVFASMTYGPVLLSCLGIAIVLLLVYWGVQALRKRLFFPLGRSYWHLTQQLLGCVLLAYVTGILLHLSSSPWLKPSLLPSYAEKYLWPYYGWPIASASAEEGWTIYPPLSVVSPLLPETRAALFKLGALLAALVGRYFWLRWSRTKLQASRTTF